MASFIDQIKADLEPHVMALPLGRRMLARTGIASAEGAAKLTGYAIAACLKLTVWIMKVGAQAAISMIVLPKPQKKKKGHH
jgi:hypothetical protein